MLANLPSSEKAAFFGLLDEYFATRPHRLPSSSGSAGASTTVRSTPVGFTDRATNAAGNAAGAATSAAVSGALRDHLSRVGIGSNSKGPPPAPPSNSRKPSFGNNNAFKSGGQGISGFVSGRTFGSLHSGSKTQTSPQAGTVAEHSPAAPAARTLPPPTRHAAAVPSPVSAAPTLQPVALPGGVIGTAEVLFDYGDGTDSDDLVAREGETIYLTEKISDDWWRASSQDLSRIGIIPTTYVRQI
ncbi:hypothetical protein BCV70DRAFT_199596 [Testicularia cyperi]|uniref:SH3 domain-containing protein n=1 Tax=Testicularia cyperi TaxID=1882483 RepID=A0A317XSL7_9BASI|nr:hypothetical protein BCV70DRAFT_199596 [Testicularia cyperi]